MSSGKGIKLGAGGSSLYGSMKQASVGSIGPTKTKKDSTLNSQNSISSAKPAVSYGSSSTTGTSEELEPRLAQSPLLSEGESLSDLQMHNASSVFSSVATGNWVEIKQAINSYKLEEIQTEDVSKIAVHKQAYEDLVTKAGPFSIPAILKESGNRSQLFHIKDRHGRNILHYACLYNTDTVATRMLSVTDEQGQSIPQDTDEFGASPLMYAIRAGMFEFIKEWHDKEEEGNNRCIDKEGYNVLHYLYGDVGLEGLDINEIAGSRQVKKAEENIRPIVRLFMEQNELPDSPDKYGTSPVMYAARKGLVEFISEWIKQDQNVEEVDSRGRNVLHYALATRKVFEDLPECRRAARKQDEMKEISQMLIDAGANFLCEDITGTSPLQYAVEDKLVHILVYIVSTTNRAREIWSKMPKELIRKLHELKIYPRVILEAEPLNVIGGYMHLHLKESFSGGHARRPLKQRIEKFEEVIMKAMLNINEVDDNGMTALHHLCYYQFDSEPYGLRDGLVAKLIDLGADPNIEDLNGFTPLMCGVDSGLIMDAELGDSRYDTGIGRLLRSYSTGLANNVTSTELSCHDSTCNQNLMKEPEVQNNEAEENDFHTLQNIKSI